MIILDQLSHDQIDLASFEIQTLVNALTAGHITQEEYVEMTELYIYPLLKQIKKRTRP